MRIVIRGGGFKNKGAEAMVRTVQAELGRRLPQATFAVRVPPSQAKQAMNAGLDTMVADGGRAAKLRRLLPCLLLSDMRSTFMASASAAVQVQAAGDFDAVVDVSGFGYTDAFGESPARGAAGWLRYCSSHGRPYIFLPQAWGPFSNQAVAKYTREACEHATLVYARDGESKRMLQELAGGRFAPVLAPDIALRFADDDPSAGRQALEQIEKREELPLVVVTPNMRAYQRSKGMGPQNRHVCCLTAVGRLCIDSFGCYVAVIPHEIDAGNRDNDDRFLCRLVAEMAGPGCFALTGQYTAGLLKSLIAQSDLVIGSRFHSLVFALGAGVPVVALGWTHKYRELLDLFGLRRFSAESSDDTPEVSALVTEAWRLREQSRVQIAARLPAVRRSVDDVFDQVARVIVESRRG